MDLQRTLYGSCDEVPLMVLYYCNCCCVIISFSSHIEFICFINNSFIVLFFMFMFFTCLFLSNQPTNQCFMVQQKGAYMSNTERLDRTTQRLQDGHRMAQETTEVAIGIMDNLHDQRGTIQRSRGRLQRTDGELSRSRRLLNGMIARARRNKVVTMFIIGIALALITIIIILIATK
eukprot:m.35836 g.35836  ORF g.35836 m.35836 type:complete len:176 (+) comp10054_c0_seq1:417-944(+)